MVSIYSRRCTLALLCLGITVCIACPDRKDIIANVEDCLVHKPAKPTSSDIYQKLIFCRLVDNVRRCIASILGKCTSTELEVKKLPPNIRFAESTLISETSGWPCVYK